MNRKELALTSMIGEAFRYAFKNSTARLSGGPLQNFTSNPIRRY